MLTSKMTEFQWPPASPAFFRYKIKGNNTKNTSKIYNLETILIPPRRFSPDCDCLICRIANLKEKEKHQLSMPEVSTPETLQQAYQIAEKHCSKCFSILGRSLPHHCNPGNRYENLRRLAEDSVGAEQIASIVIVTKIAPPN